MIQFMLQNTFCLLSLESCTQDMLRHAPMFKKKARVKRTNSPLMHFQDFPSLIPSYIVKPFAIQTVIQTMESGIRTLSAHGFDLRATYLSEVWLINFPCRVVVLAAVSMDPVARRIF